jgi:hypothetical protein
MTDTDPKYAGTSRTLNTASESYTGSKINSYPCTAC